MNRRRRSIRKWRSRGRRGQVAAVATILGLLLVVTFIANYISTTLPNEMAVNDLDHNLQVLNQLGRFQALLEQVSAQDAIGAQVVAPVTLGSSGLPPFAGADSGSIGPLNGSSYSLSIALTGPPGYFPPTGGVANSGLIPAAALCAQNPPTTTLQCTGTGGVTWNFSAATPTTYTISAASGSYAFQVVDSGASSAAHATIALTSAGSAPMRVVVVGSNDTVTLAATSATSVNLVVVGSNDTVSVGSVGGAMRLVTYIVGVNDALNFATVASTVTLAATFYGFDDSVNAGTVTSTGNVFAVYFTGFVPGQVSPYCPVGTLASGSDTVTGGTSGKGTYSATFNDTTTTAPTVPSPWTAHALAPAASFCAFFQLVSAKPVATHSAGLLAHLMNTYSPVTDIGFDAGAVVYAQPGGIPVVWDGPGISIVRSATLGVTSATLWFPVFLGTNSSEAGRSTTVLSARLLSETSFSLLPGSSYGVANDTNITFSVRTPFAAGWWAYFNDTYPVSWSGCSGEGCYGDYTGPGDLGTVTLTIPTGVNLNYFTVDVATFQFSLG